MKALPLFLLLSLGVYADTAAAQGETVEQLDVGTQSVLERLKLLRVQMALDREEIAAIELRIKKLQLQREFEVALAGGQGATPKAQKRERSASDEIIVKTIQLKPRKEAIILYRGRIFYVAPGDTIGEVTIKDITEQGIQVSRNDGGRGSVVR